MVHFERPLTPDGTRRMDLVAEKGADRLYIDVTVFSPNCRTHANKSFEKIVAEKNAEKEAKYREHARADKYRLLVFAVDTFGRVCEDGKKLLTSLWQCRRMDHTDNRDQPLRLYEILSPLSEAIAKGNAQCAWKSRMLRDFGIDFAETAWGRPKTKKAKEEEGDEFGEEKADAEATQGGEGDDADDDATNTDTNNQHQLHRDS